jgi:hypothetical protein
LLLDYKELNDKVDFVKKILGRPLSFAGVTVTNNISLQSTDTLMLTHLNFLEKIVYGHMLDPSPNTLRQPYLMLKPGNSYHNSLHGMLQCLPFIYLQIECVCRMHLHRYMFSDDDDDDDDDDVTASRVHTSVHSNVIMQTAMLQFMQSGLPSTRVPASVHCDHLIVANTNAKKVCPAFVCPCLVSCHCGC